MAVNKNFVVKNGLEVNTNLIVADTDAQKVGIGTTISRYLLHVNGGTGIGASSVYVTGISTVAQEFNVGLGGTVFTVLGNAEGTAGIGQSVGVGTGEPAYLLDVRAPVSTGQTALYVKGDARVTGDVDLDDLRLDQLQVSGISTFIGFSTFAAGVNVLGLGATTTTLNVSGVSTFAGDIDVDGHTELDDLNVSGVSTIATLAVTGVGTAAVFGGYSALSAPASAETKNFAVTVAAKTSNNRYSGGSSNAYYIDGIEAPFLTLTPGRTYRFTLSSSDMSSHPFRFYLEADKTTAYTTDVTSTSTYTEIKVTDTTPTVLHYQCSAHGYMGNSVQTNSNTIVVSAASTFSGVIDSNDATQSSSTTTGSIIASGGVGIAKNLFVGGGAEVTGLTTITGVLDANDTTQSSSSTTGAATFAGGVGIAKNLFVGGGAEVTGVTTITGTLDANGDLDVDGHTELDFVNVSAASTFVGFATFSDYVFVQDGLNVAGIITATSFDGLGQIGVGSEGTFIGVGITMVDFKSSNAGNTVDVDGTSGIATVTVQTGVSLGLAIALGG